jgi:hypothetical protein
METARLKQIAAERNEMAAQTVAYSAMITTLRMWPGQINSVVIIESGYDIAFSAPPHQAKNSIR